MDIRNGKMRMNEECEDRLSALPNDLIHKILSCLNTTEAIGTSVLSSRWRYIWTTTPFLILSSHDFSTLPKFSKFVTHFLPRRDIAIDVYSLKLSFRGKVSQKVCVKKVLDYAFGHNIQRLEVVCDLEIDNEFPLALFSSPSLKRLKLVMRRGWNSINSYLGSTWELPMLTTLELHDVTLDDTNDYKFIANIADCANLKNLTLKHLRAAKGITFFGIVHHGLANLTIEKGFYDVKDFRVVAPQLKNLNINLDDTKFDISAPKLVSLLYKASTLHIIDGGGFHSLETADICVSGLKKGNVKENVKEIVCLLEHLHNVQFLTLSLEIIELLSSSMEIFIHQPSPFVNLKTLKIYPNQWYYIPKEVTVMCDELKSYLLDNSPGSTFTMFLREEIKAQKIMDELAVMLKKQKDDTETNPKLKIGGNVEQIKSCLGTLRAQVDKARDVISKLQDIEELVIKLPASKRAKIQPCYSSLCVEADIAINLITDGMKIHCDENQSLSCVSFQMNLLKHWRRFLSNLSVPYSRE